MGLLGSLNGMMYTKGPDPVPDTYDSRQSKRKTKEAHRELCMFSETFIYDKVVQMVKDIM